MTYSAGSLIEASDYNNFASTGATNLNKIWSTGTGKWGYGQTALSLVSPGNTVSAISWVQLLNSIILSASHQGTSIAPMTTPAAGGRVVAIVPQIANNLTAIDNSRLNAISQGTSFVPSGASAVNSTPWSDRLIFTTTFNWSSENALRYYFNSGGQTALTYSHSGGGDPVDQYLAQLTVDAGTLVHSSTDGAAISISGTNYNGVTRIGGGGSVTINSTNGWAQLLSSPGTTYTLMNLSNPGGGYYSASSLLVQARYAGSGQLVYITTIDVVDSAGSFVVNGSTVSTITLRQPSTTYLSNSWGTPTASTIVTRA